MAERFREWLNTLYRQHVEAPFAVYQNGGRQHVEVGMVVEVVPESLHGGAKTSLSRLPGWDGALLRSGRQRA